MKPAMIKKVQKPKEEWRNQLTPEQFRVAREKGTERPFSGVYNDCKDEGVYRCICCGNELFDSKTKFNSGTGWPSFWAPASEESVYTGEDNALGMRRMEVLCRVCDAHLGHVFEDGPAPTGLRYCMNSVSLQLNKKGLDD